MKRAPVILLVTAVILWGAAIGADAVDASDRIWRPLLSAAAAVAVITAVHRMLGRHAANCTRSSEALASAVLSRPIYRGDTGPLARVEVISQPDPVHETPPAPARPSAHGTLRGRHASSR